MAEKSKRKKQTRNIKYGYVTFADILGWKGIWKEKEMTKVVDDLLDIEKACNEIKDKLLLKYVFRLTKNELKEFYKTEEDIKAVSEVYKNDGDYLNIIKIGRKEGYYVDKIEELHSELRKDKTNKEAKEIQRKLKQLHESQNSNPKSFNKKYDKYKVEVSVVLVSDTFVITSSSKSVCKKDELYMHIKIIQNLIGECLNYKLLIRGATSYGEYYNNGMVFIGSAIDDAASWHEQGEEIGIYMTPRGFLSTDKSISKKCIKNNLLFEGNPHLKTTAHSFETYIVDWRKYYPKYKSVIEKYKTILPEISNKIMNSNKRGKTLK